MSLFWEFFKIGMLTIGGGAAMIPQMQQTAVKDKGWLTDDEMLDCIALGQSLPGVIAVNMATFIGYRKRSIAGALTATFGVVLPAFLSMIAVLAFLYVVGNSDCVAGAFTGIKAAVCGLIGVTSFRLLKQMCGSEKPMIAFNIVMSAGALVLVGFFGITAIAVILGGIIIGILFNCTIIRRGFENSGSEDNSSDDNSFRELGSGDSSGKEAGR